MDSKTWLELGMSLRCQEDAAGALDPSSHARWAAAAEGVIRRACCLLGSRSAAPAGLWGTHPGAGCTYMHIPRGVHHATWQHCGGYWQVIFLHSMLLPQRQSLLCAVLHME